MGAGSWGTALAKHVAERGVPTRLWAREDEVAEGISRNHRNPLFLTGVDLPPHLRASTDLDAVLDGADVIVSVVPTQHVRRAFCDAGPALARAQVVVTASKGIEAESLLLPHEILAQVGAPADHLVALSGPSFAREVAAGLPTAVVAAGCDRDRTLLVRDLFTATHFRVYSSTDIGSVELGGALKNVMAIAAGVVDGLQLGDNARAAVITRGLAEMTRLGVARGGDPRTFAGLSGIGDLMLTCSGALSRNRSVGVALGRGRSWREISAEMTEVAEGVHTSRSARDLGDAHGVDMPITDQVCQILFEGREPSAAVLELISRSPRDESDQPLGAGA
ncbi:MAG TPA: NAD(P)H-dependent glycerol-3-phosphate dehydrogenase [Acidimicrobiales bacterium]|nr:NAD(P)H-dependent glycerol-3-phosphate dehydrogenase [Acidimicrobiales bacterium]